MMTDKQLRALMEWMWAILRGSANLERRAMYDAFGFVEDEDGWPTVPTHPQTLPPANRQAIADADYDAKHEALSQLIISANANGGFKHLRLFSAADIRQHWRELKAIMEPNNDTK